MIVTTASAFEKQYENTNPEYLESLEYIDALLFLGTCYAPLALTRHIAKALKQDLSITDDSTLLNRYEFYDNLYGENHLSICDEAQALVHRKGGALLQSVFGEPCNLSKVLGPYPMLKTAIPAADGSGAMRTSLTGVVRDWLISTALSGNTTFKVPVKWDKVLDELPQVYREDLNEIAEPEVIDTIVQYLGDFHVKIHLSEDDDSTPERPYYSVRLTMHFEIKMPLDVVRYIAQSDDPKVQAVALRQYNHTLNSTIYESTWTADQPIQPLSTIVENTKDIIKQKRLTNKDDLAICYDGTVRWIPTIDDISVWTNWVKDSIIEVNGVFQYNPEKIAPNKILYTDWGLSKLSYTTLAGNVTMQDLSGAKPATASHFAKMLKDTNEVTTLLNRVLGNVELYLRRTGQIKDFTDMISLDYLRDLWVRDEDWEKANAKGLEEALNSIKFGLLSPMSKVTSYVTAIISVATMMHNRSRYLVSDDDYENTNLYQFVMDTRLWGLEKMLSHAMFRPLIDMVRRITPKHYMLYAQTFGCSAAFDQIPIIHIINTYASVSDIENEDKELRKGFNVLDVPNDYTPEPVHNIKDDISFLPHQIKADYRLGKESGNTILSVAAGGGKTILALTDALRHQSKGRRVCVVCPNYLMRNYIEDASYVTGGKLNIVCIDTNVYNTYGEEKLAKLIEDAPANTLFVIGLNVFSQGKNIKYNYNGKNITINQIVEFLRTFAWDTCIIDESHTLANSNSNRSISMTRFLSDIKYIREMTGTYINNNCMDAFGQTVYMDPGIFGSRDSFIEKYAGAMRGDKVINWRHGAEREIANTLMSNVDFVNISRKEWAALLPERRDHFHIVNLSEQQQKVYRAILTAVLDEIKKDPEMMRLIEEAEASGDEADSVALEAKLRQYLARIERFLSSCDLDELGQSLLEDEDLVSPKSHKINEILADHFSQKDRGKVLIFTSYKNSAKSLYEHLDPKFKKYALHYEAERKDELIPIMKKDPNVRIVIGVEQSLNTGHNFQQFDRLIRAEAIWNPGTLDQAESRINRPDPKNKGAKRKFIDIDWILADNTIDITKTSRLVSKILSASRFNNMDPRYDMLPSLPVVSMTLSSIEQYNSYAGSLAKYAEAYSSYLDLQKAEFEEFRESTSHKEPMPIPNAGLMKGSAIIDVPFIPGMVVPFQQELGLQSIEDYALDQGKSISGVGAELKDRRVYTEFGEGVVTGTYTGSIRVKLDTGNTVSVNKLCAFLIPDGLTNVKQKIQQLVDLPSAVGRKPKVKSTKPQAQPQQVEEKPKERNRKVFVPQNDLEQDQEIEVYLGSMYNMLTVWVNGTDEDLDSKTIDKLDLNYSGDYWYCHCKRYPHLADMLALLEEKFEIPQSQLDRCYEWLETFESGRSKLFNLEKANRMEMRNWYLRKRRRVPQGELHVFPLVEDGQFFLIAFGDNQLTAKKLIRAKVKGARWIHDNEGFYFRTFARKSEIKTFITTEVKAAGLTVSNIEEVKEDYRQLKVRK